MRRIWQAGDFIQDRWEIKEINNTGGMAIVYIVFDHDPTFQEILAIKAVRHDRATPEAQARFHREALAWVNLDVHQNIVQARMIQEIDETPHLFLEYVSGGTLENYIVTGSTQRDTKLALRFALQVCDAMVYVAGKGLRAHRDIKPSNCLITEDLNLKLSDFGLAKVFEDEMANPGSAPPNANLYQTQVGAHVGTLHYKAPEQFDDPAAVDVRADLYSFGVTFYEMFKGGPPYEGIAQEIEQMHKTASVPTLDGGFAIFNPLLARLMAKIPLERFGDFNEARNAVADLYRNIAGEEPPQPAQGEDLDAVQLLNKGSSLLNLGYNEEALRAFDRVLELRPGQYQVLTNRAAALGNLGRHKEALDILTDAIRLNPRNEKAWTNRAISYWETGRRDSAIVALRRARQLSPYNPQIRYNEANYALERATTLYNSTIISGDESQRQAAFLLFNKAYEQSKLATQMDPYFTEAWVILALAANLLGRYAEALPAFEQATKLGRKDLAPQIEKLKQRLRR